MQTKTNAHADEKKNAPADKKKKTPADEKKSHHVGEKNIPTYETQLICKRKKKQHVDILMIAHKQMKTHITCIQKKKIKNNTCIRKIINMQKKKKNICR